MLSLQRWVNYRSELFTDEEQLKLNRATNFYLIIAFGWSVVLTAVLLYIWARLMEMDAERYQNYFYYFGPLSFTFNFLCLITYFGRFRFRDPQVLVGVTNVLSTACLCIMSVMAGPETHFYLLPVLLYPSPFYVLARAHRRMLFFIVGANLLMLLVSVYLLFFNPVFELYLPPFVSQDWTPVLVVLLIIIIHQVSLLIRHAEQHHFDLIAEARAETEQAYGKLKARDERIQHELNFAADIQLSLTPPPKEDQDFVSFYATAYPYGKVTGDYFDIVSDEKGMYLFLADASGHGVSAALLTIVTRHLFREALQTEAGPAEILRSMNKQFCRSIRTSDYITAFLMHLTPDGKLVYCNGGHIPPYLLRKNTADTQPLDSDGFVLGTLENPPLEYRDQTAQLAPGDRLILITDGISEEASSGGQEIGLARWADWLKEEARVESHKVFHETLIERWHSFIGHSKYKDDVTFLSAEYKG